MQKLTFSTLSLALLAACSSQQQQQEAPATVEKYSIEQFYGNTNIFGGSFSADEASLLVTSNQSDIYNVYALPVKGGEAVPLTRSSLESNFAVSYFPQDNRFLFSADKGGDENSHLYVSDGEGTVKDLTPHEGAANQFIGWSRDDQSFFYASNRRDPRYFDVYEMPLVSLEEEQPAEEMIYENKEGLDVGAISNSKRYLVLNKSITTSNNEMFLYDRESGETRHLSPHTGDATYSPQFFSLDDQSLYFITNEGDEFSYLMKYDIVTGEKEKVFQPDWDVWYAYESHHGKYRVIGVNEDARTRVYVFDNASGEEVKLPKIEGGSISSVRIPRSEKMISLTVGTSTSPSNIYLYDFETEALSKLTETLNPEIRQDQLVEG